MSRGVVDGFCFSTHSGVQCGWGPITLEPRSVKHWSSTPPWRKKRVENPTHAFVQSRINTHHFISHCVGFHSTSKGLKICRAEVKHLVIIASAPRRGPSIIGKRLQASNAWCGASVAGPSLSWWLFSLWSLSCVWLLWPHGL